MRGRRSGIKWLTPTVGPSPPSGQTSNPSPIPPPGTPGPSTGAQQSPQDPLPLQPTAANIRGFNTAADIAARESFPTKKKRGPKPNPNFGQARKPLPTLPAPFPHAAPGTTPSLPRPAGPCTRSHRRFSYTRETKLKVIDYIADRRTWVVDHRLNLKVREGLQMEGHFRPLTNEEVAALWNIHPQNISSWWSQRYAILHSKKGSRRVVVSGRKKKKKKAASEQEGSEVGEGLAEEDGVAIAEADAESAPAEQLT